MKFLRNHWYDVCGVFAVLSGIVLAVFWKQMDILRILLILNFIVVLLHQFEEYRYPGGGPAMANSSLRRGETIYDRYPLNQNNAMIGNLFVSFTLYLIPIFFPNLLWLGIAPALLGLVQIFPHVIVAWAGLKRFYTPGFLTVALGHIPIAIIYFHYITVNNLASAKDWIISVIYFLVYMAFSQVVFYKLLAPKDTKYPFPEEELNRFHMLEKVRALKK